MRILAEKFGLRSARIVRGPGKIAWQAELKGFVSNADLRNARAELEKVLEYHQLESAEESFVDRHERRISKRQEEEQRAEEENSFNWEEAKQRAQIANPPRSGGD